MRTIIAGSRDGFDYDDLLHAVEMCPWEITTVVSGTARGVDRLGERWAKEHNVPLECYPANWDEHGRSAGYIRNDQMARKAEALIALWDGYSKGTKHMINLAHKHGLQVYVFPCE